MKATVERHAGFTIVETMIFLIVTLFLLSSAFLIFNGKLQRTQFTQAVRELNTRIDTIANETSTGTYPSSPSFSCSAPGSNPVVVSHSGDTQGSNRDCIFFGKVMNFTGQKSEAYVLVGRRVDSSGSKLTTQVFDPSEGANPIVVTDPDITETRDLGYGTTVTALYREATDGSGRHAIAAIAFLQSLTGYDTVTDHLNSGSQQVDLWSINGGAGDIYTIENLVKTENMSQVTQDDQIVVCLKSGNNDQKASVTIGEDKGGLTTTTLIGDSTCP